MLFDIIENVGSNVHVGIIGGGFAGLRAARHFEEIGIDYTILEGSQRIGGRVFPFAYENGYLQYGAEYINGYDNEMFRIADKNKQFDKTKSRADDLWILEEGTLTIIDGNEPESRIMDIWNSFVEELNTKLNSIALQSGIEIFSVEDQINEHFRIFLEENKIPEHQLEIFEGLCRIYKNYFQTEWSSPISELSMINLNYWDDGNIVEDSAVLDKFGFQQILSELQSSIPKERIRLGAKVVNINYGTDGPIRIRLDSGENIEFDHVIVTCSLGYLKRNKRRLFSPWLPRQKELAIDSMGYGSNMKIFLEFQQPWWPSHISTILISNRSNKSNHGAKFEDNCMVFQPSTWATNILVAWVAGSGPYEASHYSDSELSDILYKHLKDNLKQTCCVTKIVRLYRHDWQEDEFALGSYSYIRPNSFIHHSTIIDHLAEPVITGSSQICFAGEHTDLEMYQTTVGAARSGLREAIRIEKYLKSIESK